MRAVVLSPGDPFADALAAALEPIARARGFELARAGRGELVVEAPPGRDPVTHYKGAGVAEIWRVDPARRTLEVYRLWADSYDPVAPSPDGVVCAPALDLELSVADGRLRIAWTGGVAVV